MAHVVGVPKRDPCRKCELPVFLAERLMVGKKVYHRTCLKCARCGYQLTPGSFYETEIDEQYCCETCPDEEITQSDTEQQTLRTESRASNLEIQNPIQHETNDLESPSKSVRSSIKERLAFFENFGDDADLDKKLLQKSLSDEEKSESLKRIDNLSVAASIPYESNAGVSNLLINTVCSIQDISETSQSSKVETSDSEEDAQEFEQVTLPPELPKSLPPSNEQSQEWLSRPKQIDLDTSTISTESANVDEQQNSISSLLNINLSSIDNSNNNNYEKLSHSMQITDMTTEHRTENEAVQIYPKAVENNLEFSESNDNYFVTKEKSADELSTHLAAEDQHHSFGKKQNTNADIELMVLSDEFQIGRDSEVIAGETVELRTNQNNEFTNTSFQLDNSTATKNLSTENVHLQQLEVIANNEENDEHNRQNLAEILAENDTGNENHTASFDTESHGKLTTSVSNIISETENQKAFSINEEVSLKIDTEENEAPEVHISNAKEQLEMSNSKEIIQTSTIRNIKPSVEEYPSDLNPFKSDEECEDDIESNKENLVLKKPIKKPATQANLNPFDSSDDEVELEKAQRITTEKNKISKVPPPRPPPPRISKNPFDSEDDDETSIQNFTRQSSLTGSQNRKTPIPTPRSNVSLSQNPTPEPTPRLSTKANTICHSALTTPSNSSLPILRNSSELYGSANSLYSNNATPYNLLRNSDVRSSNNSLNLSSGGTIRSRKSRRAPLPPPAPVKELFPSNETINSSSKTSTPSSSTVGTPKSSRKKRPAPAPPKPVRLEASQASQLCIQSKNLNNYPLQSELDSKLSDEEKALLEGKTLQSLNSVNTNLSISPSSRRSSKRLIPLDKELLEEHGSPQNEEGSNSQCDDLKQQKKSPILHEDEPNVVYRRVLIPQNLETPTREHNPLIKDLIQSPAPGERQMEKLKDNKEANNRNRQSQISVTSSTADDIDPLFNKSAHGKWKRRKGPAPALPLPPRKVLQMLPLQEIKHELEIIEVQQQGLEKQGVILEKMIRDRCEGENGEPLNTNGLPTESDETGSPISENPKEVENLILQLFELVNEKNELFRRQAELMYLRRQHRLEQEQADLEYEIRILMAQPERNKTDSDKAREEALIERLVEVVQLRNEVVECLEMDRLREAEEDQSIKQSLESHIAKREDGSYGRKPLIKLSKKEKKKQKEAKKLFKSKQLDADKDADESELYVDKQKSKKKKKLLIF